jgi:Uma2 family endonuclease
LSAAGRLHHQGVTVIREAATDRTYSAEDLLTIRDRDHYELVNGKLVIREKSFWSSYVAGGIHHLLSDHCLGDKLGWVFPGGLTYQCFPHAPGTVRKADVSFIRLERLPFKEAAAPGHARLAPDLVVDVVSHEDLYYDVEARVDDWLAAGVQLVWVVNPRGRSVTIRRADGSGTIVREHDKLTGEKVVPGFRCLVRELFLLPV